MKNVILSTGRQGALVARLYDNGELKEYVSAWMYNPKTGSWAQGHYFTPFGNYTADEARKDAEAHFIKNYL